MLPLPLVFYLLRLCLWLCIFFSSSLSSDSDSSNCSVFLVLATALMLVALVLVGFAFALFDFSSFCHSSSGTLLLPLPRLRWWRLSVSRCFVLQSFPADKVGLLLDSELHLVTNELPSLSSWYPHIPEQSDFHFLYNRTTTFFGWLLDRTSSIRMVGRLTKVQSKFTSIANSIVASSSNHWMRCTVSLLQNIDIFVNSSTRFQLGWLRVWK